MGIWFFAFVAVMGVARVYVGVHWPLDILAGTVVGVGAGWFIHWLLGDVRAAITEPVKTEVTETPSR